MYFLNNIPIWILGATVFIILLLALEVSFRVGLHQMLRGQGRDQDHRGEVILTAMLGFLGLLLGFTYAFTISRSDNRKSAIIEEVNALGTAFLRADFLEEPHDRRIKQVLLDYTRTRPVNEGQNIRPEALHDLLRNTLEKQERIWPETLAAIEAVEEKTPIHSLVIQANNEVLDAHTRRVSVGFDSLPHEVYFTLTLVAAASLAVAGYSAGRANALRRWRMTALAFVLSLVMQIIIDFDRPFEGFVTIRQDSYFELIDEMESSLKERVPSPPEADHSP